MVKAANSLLAEKCYTGVSQALGKSCFRSHPSLMPHTCSHVCQRVPPTPHRANSGLVDLDSLAISPHASQLSSCVQSALNHHAHSIILRVVFARFFSLSLSLLSWLSPVRWALCNNYSRRYLVVCEWNEVAPPCFDPPRVDPS